MVQAREISLGQTLLALLVAAAFLIAAPVAAQGTDDPTDAYGDEGEMSLDEISRMLDNPLGNLWMIFTENQMQRFRGDPSDGSQWVNTLLLQPIMPIPLTDNWNLIARPILPFITAPKFDIDAEFFGDCPPNCNSDPPPSVNISSSRHNAWGDLMGWTMLSPAEPRTLADGSKFVWGVGPAFRFPTATDDQFGSERYSFGPSSILMRLPSQEARWTFGLFQQHHIWSFGGNSDRARVKTSNIQYIWWYQLPTETPISVGAAPMIDINWEADDNDKVSLPIGIGASTTFFVGKMPVRFGVEFDWYVVSPNSYGKKFMLKFFFVPVIPKLIKKPLFGD